MLALIFVLFLSSISPAAVAEPTGPCCFVHPNYSGICVVDPAPDESCTSILAYLNTPGTAGKAYCGNTPIRGGWSQVRCQ